MKVIKDETGIPPFEEYSAAFRILYNAKEVGYQAELGSTTASAAGIIWDIAFSLFKKKIYEMHSLETSLVVKAYDCFAPLDRHLYEYTCLHWLGVLADLQGLAGPEIVILEVKNRKTLSFRFSISERIKKRYRIR